MQETWVLSLDQEDPLEKEMEPIPVLLPGESHGGLQSMDLKRVRHNSVTQHTHAHCYCSNGKICDTGSWELIEAAFWAVLVLSKGSLSFLQQQAEKGEN